MERCLRRDARRPSPNSRQLDPRRVAVVDRFERAYVAAAETATRRSPSTEGAANTTKTASVKKADAEELATAGAPPAAKSSAGRKPAAAKPRATAKKTA